MNLARISANGQITVPLEIRRLFSPGRKYLPKSRNRAADALTR